VFAASISGPFTTVIETESLSPMFPFQSYAFALNVDAPGAAALQT
jgi:hypothetical protein